MVEGGEDESVSWYYSLVFSCPFSIGQALMSAGEPSQNRRRGGVDKKNCHDRVSVCRFLTMRARQFSLCQRPVMKGCEMCIDNALLLCARDKLTWRKAPNTHEGANVAQHLHVGTDWSSELHT